MEYKFNYTHFIEPIPKLKIPFPVLNFE